MLQLYKLSVYYTIFQAYKFKSIPFYTFTIYHFTSLYIYIYIYNILQYYKLTFLNLTCLRVYHFNKFTSIKFYKFTRLQFYKATHMSFYMATHTTLYKNTILQVHSSIKFVPPPTSFPATSCFFLTSAAKVISSFNFMKIFVRTKRWLVEKEQGWYSQDFFFVTYE